jgi:uncharacterized protein YnzC (UPF0291/DUF896 family)
MAMALKESILKALRARESQRQEARYLQYIRGKLRTGSTTMVTLIDPNGNRIDLTDHLEMEQTIL